MPTTLTQEWSAKIAAWRHSGLNLAAWCRENSENYHRVLYWRKRLAAAPEAGKFLELTIPAAPISLECNGVLIHVSRGYDRGLLSDIVSVLRRD